MAIYKTTYTDPMNKTHTGYIINGKTYKDKEGTQRVEQGSIVETLDGSYMLTKNGGVKATDYKDEINNLGTQIGTMKSGNASQHESMYKSKKASIDNEKKRAEADYRKQAEEQYIKSMESQKNINQLLKAQGINGGMSESMLLANQLAHEQAVNELQFRKADRLNELEAKILELRNETDYNIAAGNAEIDKLYLQYYDSILDRAADDEQFERQLASQNYRFQKDLEQADKHFYDELNWEKEVQEMENQQFYDKFNWDKETYERDYALKEKEVNHEIADDNRNYSLKAQKSSSGSNYDRDLKYAKILAEIGDYSGYAKLFGLDPARQAELEFYFDKRQK